MAMPSEGEDECWLIELIGNWRNGIGFEVKRAKALPRSRMGA